MTFQQNIINKHVLQGEHIERQILQTVTLLKSIYLLTSRLVAIFIINNDHNLFEDVLEKVKGWNVDADKVLRFESSLRVKVDAMVQVQKSESVLPRRTWADGKHVQNLRHSETVYPRNVACCGCWYLS